MSSQIRWLDLTGMVSDKYNDPKISFCMLLFWIQGFAFNKVLTRIMITKLNIWICDECSHLTFGNFLKITQRKEWKCDGEKGLCYVTVNQKCWCGHFIWRLEGLLCSNSFMCSHNSCILACNCAISLFNPWNLLRDQKISPISQWRASGTFGIYFLFSLLNYSDSFIHLKPLNAPGCSKKLQIITISPC